jgi:hypothetical protein
LIALQAASENSAANTPADSPTTPRCIEAGV